jgi:predicted RND superfamily exporter protein
MPGGIWARGRARLLRHRGLLALLSLLLSVLIGTGIGRLDFTTDYRVFFSEDNPDLAQLEFIERNFARAESLVITVAPEDGEVFSNATLNAVRELVEDGVRLPYAKGASAITNYYPARGEEDDIVIAALIPDRELDAAELADIRRQALSDERIVNITLAADGDVTGVIIHFELPHAEPQVEIRAVAAATAEMMAGFAERHPDIEAHLAGVIMLNQAMSEVLLSEGRSLYPLAFTVMFVLLSLLYRSVTATLGTILVVVFSVATAMGAAGWLGITLTSPSLTAGLVVLTLAVADCVHMLSTMGSRMAAGADAPQAMEDSLRVNVLPIALTSVTTTIGFLALNLSDSPPFRDLGNIVAIGVMAAFAYSLCFLPWWAMRFPVRRPPITDGIRRALLRLADWVIAHKRMMLGLGLVLTIGGASAVTLNRFGDDYVKFFNQDHPFRLATEFTNDRLTGMQYLEYVVDAGVEGGALEPEFLHRMDRFADWLRQQPEVRKVSSIIGVLESLNQAMNADDPAFYRIPDGREEAAQYVLLYELSLPSGVDLTHLLNLDKSAARMTVQLDTISSEAIRLFDDRARAWQSEHSPEAEVVRGAGVSIMFAHIARRNFASMLWGTMIAFALIIALLYFGFRSRALALISIAPNLLPIILGFGAWGLTVGQVGMSLAVVGSLTLGIIVDDTLHLLNRYARARREGRSAEDAIRESMSQVGVALVVTSLVLFAGFMVFTASGFLLTVHLGLLTAMVIVIALLADFLLLPPLLLWADSKTDWAS